MRVLIWSVMMVGVLSGCVTQNPAKTRIYTPGGVVEVHCPPGQAKKGKCAHPF